MAFGVKVKTVKTSNKYTIESFYEAIKDKKFTAGEPSLTKHGLVYVITFPALDSRNQVWIMRTGFGQESNKFQVQKQEQQAALFAQEVMETVRLKQLVEVFPRAPVALLYF